MKVIKFGGSSIANTNKLKLAAQKTISFLESGEKVVAILSAQGKTTDNLIKEAKELTDEPNKRELDVLMSVGEQMACSKFAILLHSLGYKAVSLTGWQAGIVTDSNYTEAKIQDIYPKMIWSELETNDVVVITGFQGINENNKITTLGRNGSDTTAIAIAAALEQDECYIFTDTNGVYDNLEAIDELIEKNLKGWSKSRISRVVLTLMRIATFEIMFVEDVPTSVSINESVELCKKYATEKDASFLNGVLGGVARSAKNNGEK